MIRWDAELKRKRNWRNEEITGVVEVDGVVEFCGRIQRHSWARHYSARRTSHREEFDNIYLIYVDKQWVYLRCWDSPLAQFRRSHHHPRQSVTNLIASHIFFWYLDNYYNRQIETILAMADSEGIEVVWRLKEKRLYKRREAVRRDESSSEKIFEDMRRV